MKYMGSKARIAKHILPLILKDRTKDQCYVEPFVGGANMIDKVDGNRIGGEFNVDIANMWAALERGWIPNKHYTKDEYDYYKNLNSGTDESHIKGYVGICCSYSGKYYGGYAGRVTTKNGTVRDYQDEAFRNVIKQIPGIKGVRFISSSYNELPIPSNSIIYCDPPYSGATGYSSSFNSEQFWEWCRQKVVRGYKVFVSEYNAPSDFVCIWEKQVSSSLRANGVVTGNKKSVERLFVHKSQL